MQKDGVGAGELERRQASPQPRAPFRILRPGPLPCSPHDIILVVSRGHTRVPAIPSANEDSPWARFGETMPAAEGQTPHLVRHLNGFRHTRGVLSCCSTLDDRGIGTVACGAESSSMRLDHIVQICTVYPCDFPSASKRCQVPNKQWRQNDMQAH